MPQKIIFSKAPLIQIAHSSLSRGMVRVSNPEIKKLYHYLSGLTHLSEALEPAFSLSCLLKNEPLSEKPAKVIMKHLQDKADGSFNGNIQEQIFIARAALSLFEYTTDRNILNRLVSWCRFLETEWDTFEKEFCIRIQCADLMEFLVRLYRISGVKAILRICAKLRSASFDWVSYLHNEKCRGSVFFAGKEKEITDMFHSPLGEEIDYFQTQYYINHAELVADAVRYSAYAGIFSGNSQELSAGKTGWSQIYKEYHTVCGGTSGAPFFDGNGTNASIHSGAIAAWTEALTAQSMLLRESWAINELVLLIFNALPVALRNLDRTFIQRVNTLQHDIDEKVLFSPFGDNDHESVRISCRLGRAVTAACHHAITVSKNEICINYLIHGTFFIAGNADPIILQLTDHSVVFHNSDQESHSISLYIAQTETDVPVLSTGKRNIPIEFPEGKNRNIFIRLSRKWGKGDGILFLPGDQPYIKECHHQGLCCYLHHRLMVLDTQNRDYAFAAIDDPIINNNKVYLSVRKIKNWKIKDGLPADIPVRPKSSGENMLAELGFYHETSKCISVFPKAAENE